MPPLAQLESDPLAGDEKYDMIKMLGRGAFGSVVLAKEKDTGQLVALTKKYVRREVINHSSLTHPHIVKFRECFLTDKYLAIAMEYAAGGDMFKYVSNKGGLDEKEARWFFKQLILALDYCHKMGVSNRDIKLENTLLDRLAPGHKPVVKLCDFGLSINESNSQANTMEVGTPGYCAPELLEGGNQGGRGYDSKLADVWSCGVMLYTMLFCIYPFDDPKDKSTDPKIVNMNIRKRVMKGTYSYPRSPKVTAECRDLLDKIFVVTPKERITLLGIQAHPWFKKDFPENLDLHKVNAAYVDMAQSRLNEGSIEIIDRVIHEACAGVDTRPPAIAGNGCSLGDLDDFMDGLDLEQ